MAVAEFRFYEELNDFLTPARRRRAFDYDCAPHAAVKGSFRQPATPREWFLVPLFVIDEAVVRIKDGTMTGCQDDPKLASPARTAS